MKNFWKVVVVGVAAVGLFGAVCSSSPAKSNLNLSVKLEQGDVFQYGATMYAFDQETSRGIPTPEVFTACGFKYDQVKVLEKGDFDQIPVGTILSADTCPKK